MCCHGSIIKSIEARYLERRVAGGGQSCYSEEDSASCLPAPHVSQGISILLSVLVNKAIAMEKQLNSKVEQDNNITEHLSCN